MLESIWEKLGLVGSLATIAFYLITPILLYYDLQSHIVFVGNSPLFEFSYSDYASIGFLIFFIAISLLSSYSFASQLIRTGSNFFAFIFFLVVFAYFVPLLFGSLYIVLHILNEDSGGCIDGLRDVYDPIYYSYTTLTTLGYGDLAPVGVCRLISSAQAILGYIFLGVLAAVANRFIAPRI